MSDGVALVDVNVLVAFLWPPHTHHRAARAWFAAARPRGWASCPMTEMGCVRVLSANAVSQGSLTVSTAAARLGDWLSDDRHVFWPDDLALSDHRLMETLPHIQGPNQLTDRYLLALAAAHDGTLATFDRSAGSGLPAGSTLLTHLEIVTS